MARKVYSKINSISLHKNKNRIAFKVLTAALLAGCISGGPVFAAEPVLDALHNEGILMPESDVIYPASEYEFVDYVPSDPDNLPANVVKYYDSQDSGVRYYAIQLKNPQYGEGDSVKYYKWLRDDKGVSLVETDNAADAVLTVHYNEAEPISPVIVPDGSSMPLVKQVYAGKNIKSAISVRGNVNNISSKFIGNTVSIDTSDTYDYSVILEAGKLDGISSSFVGNNITVNAGDSAIYGTLIKSFSNTGNISSEFIGNKIDTTSTISGGLVYAQSQGIINTISSDFIKNSVVSSNAGIMGGVLGNEGVIENLGSSRFLENYSASDGGTIRGGALYNSGTLSIKDSQFTGNYGSTVTGDSRGGAIYNALTLNITNSVFRDNYASSSTGSALGGAIYTDTDIKIFANDGKSVEFTGNYIENFHVRENQAIYVGSKNALLTMTLTDGGKIILNDSIDGQSGYRVYVTGDNTGTLYLNNNISNANLTIEGVNVDTADGKFLEYNILSLDSSDSVNYKIDVDLGGSQSDKFIIGEGSRGVINISDINFQNMDAVESAVVKVLEGSSSVSISLGQDLIDKYSTVTEKELASVVDTSGANVSWSDRFYEHLLKEVTTTHLSAVISDSARAGADSIKYTVEKEVQSNGDILLGDTLRIMNNKKGTRSFTTTDASYTYDVTENLGDTGYGTLTVSGAVSGDEISTINAGQNTLFNVIDSFLILKDVKITNTAGVDGSVLKISEGHRAQLGGTMVIEAQTGENAIVNDGTIEIRDSSNITTNSNIIGSGTLSLSGKLVNLTLTEGASIEQGSVAMASSGSTPASLIFDDNGTLKADSIKITAGSKISIIGDNLLSDVTATGTSYLELRGGALNTTVSGTGYVNIAGDVLVNTDVLTQVRLAKGAVLTTAADYVKNNIVALTDGGGTINLTGGTLTSNITDRNSTVNIDGHVIFDKSIKVDSGVNIGQDDELDASAGSFNSTAAGTFGGINNDGIINISGDTETETVFRNYVSIKGSGVTNITSGNVKLGSTGNLIHQSILNIMPNARLITSASYITSNTDAYKTVINNNGLLDFTSGTLSSAYVDSINGDGTVRIGTIGRVSFADGVKINQSIDIAQGGSLNTSAANIGGAVHNDGTLDFAGADDYILKYPITGSGKTIISKHLTSEALINNDISLAYGIDLTSNGDLIAGNVSGSGNLKLTGGTLRSDVENINVYAVEGANVVIDAIVNAAPIILLNNSVLSINADNIQGEKGVRVYENAVLKLTGGTLNSVISKRIYNSLNTLVEIAGDVTLESSVNPPILIDNGSKLTADSKYLYDTVTNEGELYLSGSLKKSILGGGTTFIDDTLTLANGSSISGNFNLNNGLLGVVENNYGSYTLGKVTGEGDLDLNFNIATSSPNTFTLDPSSDGIFNITNINYYAANGLNVQNRSVVYNILKGLTEDSSARLVLKNPDLFNFAIPVYKASTDKVLPDVYFDDKYETHTQTGILPGTLSLTQTVAPDDSIKMNYGTITWNDVVDERADLLADWWVLGSNDEKYFRFRSPDDKYTVIKDPGIVTNSKLNIIGAADKLGGVDENGNIVTDAKRSVIDMDGHSGFRYNGGCDLNISDVQFTNLYDFVIGLWSGSTHTMGSFDEAGSPVGGVINVAVNDNNIDIYNSHYNGLLNLSYTSISQITNSEFKNNTFNFVDDDDNNAFILYAAAIKLLGSTLGSKEFGTGGILNSVFDNNSVSTEGVGPNSLAALVLLQNAYVANIDNSYFTNNAYSGKFSIVALNNEEAGSITNSHFINNSTGLGTTLRIHNNSNIGKIENVEFIGNSTQSYGGAIYVDNAAVGTITDCFFEDNTVLADNGGMAIFANHMTDIGEISNTIFRNNKGTIGALCSNGSLGKLVNSEFSGNEATKNAPAFVFNAALNEVANLAKRFVGEISDVKILNNKLLSSNANVAGLAYLATNTGSINNLTVSGNVATGYDAAGQTDYAAAALLGNFVINNVSVDSIIGNLNPDVDKSFVFENNIIQNFDQAFGAGLALRGRAQVGKISGLFFNDNGIRNNRRGGSGGAFYIDNYNTDKNIIGEFTNVEFNNNFIEDSNFISSCAGGAMSINRNLFDTEFDNLTFKGNYVYGGNTSRGGALSSIAMTLKNSLFEGNHVAAYSEAQGGAWASYLSFNNRNSVTAENVTFINNWAESIPNSSGEIAGGAYGGALYYSSIGDKELDALNIVNSTFIGNHVLAPNGIAKGGAIYFFGNVLNRVKNFNISANNGMKTLFSGNYTMKTGDESTKDFNAIYVLGYNATNPVNLTISAVTGGNVIFEDNIRGSNYNVILTGDSDSKISLYNNIYDALNITAENTNINMINGEYDNNPQYFNYNFKKLTSSDSAKYALDINFEEKLADTFTVGKDSSGIILLNELNISGDKPADNVTVQIIDAVNDNIQLALNSEKYTVVNDIITDLSDTVYNNVEYHQDGGFSLATTQTSNDSIKRLVEKDFDALNIIGKSTNNEIRNFVFQSADKYNVTVDLDPLAAGTLNIKGVQGRRITSVIDANNHSLFKLNKDNTLNIFDTRLTGAETIISGNGTVNLNNAYIDGNIKDAAVFVNGRESILNGTADNVTLQNGNLKFNDSTFANGSLNAVGGTVALADGKVQNYQFKDLSSSNEITYDGNGANWTIDLDLSGQPSADTITLNSAGNHSGIIEIAAINYLNQLDSQQDFVIKVLDGKTDNVQLALGDNINNYIINDSITRIINDEVYANTKFDDVYYIRTENGILYGDLYLATSVTENDSLGFKVTTQWDEGSLTILSQLGDTLNLINTKSGTRSFNSSQSSDVYDLTQDLDQTAEGLFSLNGVTTDENKSTINLNGYKGFTVGANTELDINDIKITGADDIFTVTNSGAVFNLNGAYIDGNIIGLDTDNNFNINISGQNLTTIAGSVVNANVALNNGSFSFGENTFADANSVLTVNNGNIKMNNGVIENYVISNLNSGNLSRYDIDIDLDKGISDTITVQNGSGPVILNSLNIVSALGNVDPTATYIIPIIYNKNNSDSLYLRFTENVMLTLDKEQFLGTNSTVISTDEVNPVSSWNANYYQTEQLWDILGYLSLGSKNTKNDSIMLYSLRIDNGREAYLIGDTLKLLSQLESNEDRHFVFDTENDVYVVGKLVENDDRKFYGIGNVTAGKLYLDGVAGLDSNGNPISSVIDLNTKSGFALSEAVEMNVSNITFDNFDSVDASLINITNKNAVLNLYNVNVLNKNETANAISNAGTINMTGGDINLQSGIKGAGITNISNSNVKLSDNVSITQKEVNVESGTLTLGENGIINADLNIKSQGSVIAAASALKSAVDNDGRIDLTGGNLIYNISGSGKVNIVGDVVNRAVINQDVDVISGVLTTSASNLKANINNQAEILLNGTLNSIITGNGTTVANEALTLEQGAQIQGTFDLNNASIATNDNLITDYNLGTVINKGNFSIDIDAENRVSDKIIVSDRSNGVINLENVNFHNIQNIDYSIKIQVLDVVNPKDGSNISLTISDTLKDADYKLGRTQRDETDSIKNHTAYDDLYYNYIRGGDVYGSLNVGTTGTEDDSIVIAINKDATKWDNDRSQNGFKGDTLALWNSSDPAQASDNYQDKQFIFNRADNVYVVGNKVDVEGLGKTVGENVSLIGVSADEFTKSTVNLNGKSGFELYDNTNFTIQDVKLTNGLNNNLISVFNKDAVLNIQNSYINGNITSQADSYNVNISGVTNINGNINNAYTTLQSGTLKFNTDTFADSSNTLDAQSGNIVLNNKVIENYNIANLVSDESVKYSLDINLTREVSDTINVQSGSGIIYLDNLTIAARPENYGKDYVVQIIKDASKSDNLQLSLSDYVKEQLGDESYLIGTDTEYTYDKAKEVTNWKDEYNQYSQTFYTYGKLGLVTVDTINDSIGINVSHVTVGEIINSGIVDNTLKFVNESTDVENKIFEFDTAKDEYTSISNLGLTKNSLTINGITDGENYSTINLNSYSGFELDENSTLTISNVALKNASGEQGSVIYAPQQGKEITLTNVQITDNNSSGTSGAAIYSLSDINLTADNGSSVISNNNTSVNNEAIYLGKDVSLTLNSINNGSIIIADNINGSEGYKVNISGDETGKVYLSGKTDNAVVSMNDVTLYLSSGNHFETSAFTVNSGTIDMINGAIHQQVAREFNVAGSFTLNADVDLLNEQMDRLPYNTVIANGALINVDRLNLISDSKSPTIAIPFAYDQFKDSVNYIGAEELSKDTQITAFAPIYKYNVKYNRDNGYFEFNRFGGGASGGSSESFNPAVLASGVSSQVGAYSAMNQAFNYAFEHADTYTLMPLAERLAARGYNNRIAINSDEIPKYQLNAFQNNGIWYKPFVTFENIGLHNGPKVDVITYGSMAGGDSGIKELKNGWATVTSAYIGYTGSSQDYSGVSTYQNGGLLGATQTWYKHNFFTALTASVGATAGESNTMYGKEDFASLMAGVASKSGYNLEFKEGRFIIQPMMFLSYTFVNTFDYTNAAGVKIDSDPLHVLQIHPQIRFIANTKSGWQPYFSAGMVWNLMDKTKMTANDVRLPQMSIKPYVEYGIGIKKSWGDRFSGYLQSMIRNGGRNGIALSLGFRWELGDNKNIETVSAPDKNEGKVKPVARVLKPAVSSQKKNLHKPDTL